MRWEPFGFCHWDSELGISIRISEWLTRIGALLPCRPEYFSHDQETLYQLSRSKLHYLRCSELRRQNQRHLLRPLADESRCSRLPIPGLSSLIEAMKSLVV